MSRRTTTVHTGVALGAGGLTATYVVSGAHRTHVIAFHGQERGALPLVDAFAELHAHLRGVLGPEPRLELSVALMPTLCDTRLIDLPPLRPGEAALVLRREASRHFIGHTQSSVVGVRTAPSARSLSSLSAPTRGGLVMACAASESLLDEIRGGAEAAGFALGRITAAQAAWLRLAAPDRTGQPRPQAVIAIDDGTAYAVRLEGGAPVQMRRLGPTHHDAVSQAIGAAPGTVWIVSDDDSVRGRLSAQLAATGWSALPVDRSAAVAAAMHAASADLSLVSDRARAGHGLQQRGLANRLAAAAVVLLLASAIIGYWGARHEVSVLRGRRAAIRAQVQPLLALRDTIAAIEDRARAADAVYDTGPRWSRTLHEITMLLPRDAYITRLNATGDTLLIEGQGSSAGDALEAIRRAPTLHNVHMQGAVQRELEQGATTTERFTIQATLASGQSSNTAQIQARHVIPTRTARPSDSAEGGVD